MREILEALESGEISVSEAEARMAGYVTTESGRFDAAREQRGGVPEAVLADGKSPREVADLVSAAVDSTGHALVTRAQSQTVSAIRERVSETTEIDYQETAQTVVVHTSSYDPPSLDATVAVVTAGTSDIGVAAEAIVVAEQMGADIERIEDVGVAGIHRLFDVLEPIRSADVTVVAAGREGALPTIIAGLIDNPVIGLPVSSGYGYGGGGEAALQGMLQSCTALSVVNIDAGFVAGAQAGLIASQVSAQRNA